MSNDKLPILVAGDVNGKLDVLYKRCTSLMKKNKFTMLFCVGEFFDHKIESEFLPYLLGEKKVTIQTYIVGPIDQGNRKYFTDDLGCDLCENLTYLGNHGIFKTGEGLSIGYLNTSSRVLGDDASSIFKTVDSTFANFRGLDLLLTADWPKDVAKYAVVPPESDHKCDERVEAIISQTALLLKPRYHFASRRGIYYDRIPYRNHMVLNETQKHVTRFLGLADVANQKKAKWMYAFSIAPLASLTGEQLRDLQPDQVTERPYTFNATCVNQITAKRCADDVDQRQANAGSFFYAQTGAKKPRREKNGGAGDRQPKFGQCWFCLGFDSTEKHLVVCVGEHIYAVLPKGPVNHSHLLIVPIHHHKSMRGIEDTQPDIVAEVKEYKEIVKSIFSKQNKKVIFFERNFVTMHIQIEAIAIDASISDENIQKAFETTAKMNNLKMLHMQDKPLLDFVGAEESYFHVTYPNGSNYIIKSGKDKFPLAFGRMAIASSDILNNQELIFWKQCEMSRKDSDVLVSRLRLLWKEESTT